MIGKALAGQSKKDTVYVTIIIIHKGRSGPGRKTALVVIDLTPQLVEHLRQGRLVILVLEVNLHKREVAGGFGLYPIDLAELLNRHFDNITDFLLHFRSRRTGIGRDHDRILNGKLRIFKSRHALESFNTNHKQQNSEGPGNHTFLDC